ncbi:MAG: hypothetical protein PHN18_01210 [Sulfurospirillaceae bacterium]|nr:hypothetical protein [Sulfurospirillaceae bacterium]MDD2826042.1 hypothetical protein [Sulfurospirillaceae bacterium]
MFSLNVNVFIFFKIFAKINFLLALFLILFCSSMNLHAGWLQKNERPFTLRNTNGVTGDNIYGDFNVTGAPILCVTKTNGQCDWNYTGMLATANSKYLVDKPTSQIPLNSSSADLTIPSDATIIKAYLYWSGHIHGNTATQTAYNAAIDGYNSVIFRTPDGNDHTITANINDTTKVNYYTYLNDTINTKGFRLFYQATVDVTDIVKNGGYASNKKQFTVGNIKVTAGPDQTLYEPEINGNVVWGPMGGWSLVVEYTRPVASGQKYKNVSIYDGFQFLLPPTNQTESIDINISGFLTPLTQVPTGSMAFYAMGSEKKLTGEKVKLSNKAGILQDVYNSINPVGEFLNDSISIFGTNLDATRIFNPGIDLDVFNIATSCKNSSGATVACIDTNQTSTTLQLSVKNTNNTSDQSFPGMIAFSVDIYQPNISSFRKDSNTSVTQILYPNDSVEYTLDLNNSGTEAAENITIFDTFSSTVGSDMLLDLIDRNATAIKNSIRLKSYSEANYHCAIGSTDPACATLAQDANCSVDYADNNISQATKVWCNVPYMAVNARELMKFSITIRNDYNQTLADQNVTNVAYAEYYNAATHEKISVLGQSNINTAGTIGGLLSYNSLLDVVDNYDNTYNYNALVGLKTKIANSTNKTLEAVYLGSDPTNPIPSLYIGPTYDMLVLFRLSNDTCTEDLPISSTGDVTTTFVAGANQYTSVSNAFTLVNQAKKVSKIKTHFIDWNKISLNLIGNNCVNNSSILGNLKGVPQCVNGNEDKIQNLMTVDVTECITAPVGKDAACYSEAYNSSGSKGNIYPPKYNNTYGCLMCLSDKVNGTNNCSRDNFAIRPNDFNSSISANQLFVAEQNNAITFRANQYGGIGTLDYNESMNTSFTVDINISDSNKTCVNPSIQLSPNIVFVNGLVTNNYMFSNVGDFNLSIHDINGSEFALIDADDTPDNTRFITPFVQQIKVIPSTFQIDGNFTNTANNFTYLSNFEAFPNAADRNMSANLDLNISALGALNTIMSNYTSQCYAQDGNLTATLNSALVINPTTALTKVLWYDNLHSLNGSVPLNGTTSYIMDFNRTQFDSNDANGTAHVNYRINFDRNTTKTVKPILFNLNNVRLTDVNSVTGAKILNQTATFYYGRTHAPDYRFSGVTSGLATIYYEVSCKDCNLSERTAFGITGNESVDAIGWYQNVLHANTMGTAAPSTISANITVGAPTHTVDTTTTITTTTLPNIGKINLNGANWLVHYPTDFTVEFFGSGQWAGSGFVKPNQPSATDTNTTVGEHVHKTAPIRSNRRITW